MSVVKEESILSLRMRSVLLRFNSSLSAVDKRDNNKASLNILFVRLAKGFFLFCLGKLSQSNSMLTNLQDTI